MAWKTRQEAHAIERVRVMINFAEPVPSKLLRSATAGIVESANDHEFSSVEPANSGINILEIGPNTPPVSTHGQKNGVVMKRFMDEELVEEVGFRDLSFGYMTTTYGRWSNLINRLQTVVFPSLFELNTSVDLTSIKLEYWDSFQFEGDKSEADASLLLSGIDGTIPERVIQGGALWHSHSGWFEDGPILINRNIDLLDQKIDEDTVRVLGFYTMVEQRTSEDGFAIENTEQILNVLHNKSAVIFGESLQDDFRKMIGLDLENYK